MLSSHKIVLQFKDDAMLFLNSVMERLVLKFDARGRLIGMEFEMVRRVHAWSNVGDGSGVIVLQRFYIWA